MRISSSFEGFCVLLGLQNVGPYLQLKDARNIEDWSSVSLDAQGRQIQEEMTKKFQVCLWVLWMLAHADDGRICRCEAPRRCFQCPRIDSPKPNRHTRLHVKSGMIVFP